VRVGTRTKQQLHAIDEIPVCGVMKRRNA
jgi:hypothetical protein